MKWQGKGVSEGLAMAKLYLFTPKLPEISRQPAADAETEVARLEKTLAAAEEELRGLYETAKEKMGEQEAEIFDAHLTILSDEYSVREPILQRIREQKQNAAAAITDQFDELAQMFRSLGDELMAERAADAEDLKQLLLRICLGCGRQDLSVLPGDVIVLAEELTPSDTVRMDTAHVKGIATKLGGATAHSAIIARTLGIPAAAGIDGWQTGELNGHMAILDGADGSLIVDPTAEETADYQCRKTQADSEAQALEAFRSFPSQTKDGISLEICANIGTPQEAQQAMEYGQTASACSAASSCLWIATLCPQRRSSSRPTVRRRRQWRASRSSSARLMSAAIKSCPRLSCRRRIIPSSASAPSA